MTALLLKPHYPGLRDAADRASSAAQRTFLRLNRLQLALLTLAAFISGLGYAIPSHQKAIAWIVSVAMSLALFVSTALRIGRFDDRWFECRAFAENFKNIVWLYVMSPHNTAPTNIDRYLSELGQLRKRLPNLQKEFARFKDSGNPITDWMKEAQALPIALKASLYREQRIQDQAKWYSSKAKLNARLEHRWFWAIFGIEFFAITVSVFQATELLKFNPVGGIAAVGTAFIAWSQIKRFSDLATSYAIAADDLEKIAAAYCNVQTQADLDSMVDEVEKAVSREHTMWLARRKLNC